jgi:hypothetical protein
VVTVYVTAACGIAFAAMLALISVALRQQKAIERLEERLGHLLAGISILTDTTEGGLRDDALELGRLGATAPKPKARAATARRITGAVKRGRTVRDIAAAEKLSEGEVRLRLSLNDAASKSQVAHASMR